MINGVAHGPDRGTTVCQLHMRRFKDGETIIDRAVARARPSRSSRISSSIAAPSTASSPPAATSRSTSAARRTRNSHPDPEGRSPTRRWTRRRASAAAPASRPARTPRRTCSRAPRSRTSALLPQGQLERDRRVVRDGRADGRRRLRQLLERRRMRGGVPEGDSDLEHRADDARVHQGAAGAVKCRARLDRRGSPTSAHSNTSAVTLPAVQTSAPGW